MTDELKEGSKKFCILVTSSPESVNSRTLFKMTETAIGMGHNVQIFLMCDGVYHILYQDFLSLIEKGAEVILCAQNALERGIEKKPGVLFRSQYDLASMVSQADGFLSLT
jgi:sulfur relay (sulfurtransferase) complex TusBCD TusD component (DsrE family)